MGKKRPEEDDYRAKCTRTRQGREEKGSEGGGQGQRARERETDREVGANERERGGSGRKEEHARWKQGQETRARLVSSPSSVTEKEGGRSRVDDVKQRSDGRRAQKNDLSPSARKGARRG